MYFRRPRGCARAGQLVSSPALAPCGRARVRRGGRPRRAARPARVREIRDCRQRGGDLARSPDRRRAAARRPRGARLPVLDARWHRDRADGDASAGRAVLADRRRGRASVTTRSGCASTSRNAMGRSASPTGRRSSARSSSSVRARANCCAVSPKQTSRMRPSPGSRRAAWRAAARRPWPRASTTSASSDWELHLPKEDLPAVYALLIDGGRRIRAGALRPVCHGEPAAGEMLPQLEGRPDERIHAPDGLPRALRAPGQDGGFHRSRRPAPGSSGGSAGALRAAARGGRGRRRVCGIGALPRQRRCRPGHLGRLRPSHQAQHRPGLRAPGSGRSRHRASRSRSSGCVAGPSWPASRLYDPQNLRLRS